MKGKSSLQWHQHVGDHMENLEDDHDSLDLPEGSLEDETGDEKDESLFHDAGLVSHAVRVGL